MIQKESIYKTIAVFALLLFAILPLNSLLKISIKAATTDEFIQVVGKDLIYKGQKVVLRGANFANISALLGTNIGGIGSGRIEDIEVREEDYKAAREVWGMNHIRFGMSYSWWTNDTTANKANFFATMDQHVAWAKKYGMWITLLQFTLPGDCYEGYNEDCFSFWDSQSKRDELKNFWVQVAQHYVNEPAVSFDLINEPVGSPSTGWSSAWSKSLAQVYINAVRSVNTKALLFVTADSDGTFPITYTGSNLVYEIHFYEPMAITHNYSNASNTYPGQYCNEWKGGCITWNRDSMNNFMKNYYSVNWAIAKNVPLYVGEWGSLTSSTNGYITYLNDMAYNLSALGLNHAYYSFKAGNSWGMYKKGWPLVEREPAKNAAIKKAFEGNIFMDSVITTPTDPVVPTEPTPTDPVVPTPTPVPVPVEPSTSYTYKFRFHPRFEYPERMIGGKFQGSNTSSTSGFVDLYTIKENPADWKWNEVSVISTTQYKYLRYIQPGWGFGTVAELEFYKNGVKLNGTVFGSNSTMTKAFDGKKGTYFQGTKAYGQYVGLKF